MSDPGASGYVVLLRRCIAGRDLEGGRRLHAQIVRSGWHTDLFVANLLIQMYGACRSIASAMAVFRELRHRDTVAWNAMIQALAENGRIEEARQVFDSMTAPRNLSSWNTIISAYAQAGLVDRARELFDQTLDKNVVTWTAMMHAHGQAGELREARSILDSMPEPNIVSWTTMITAYAQHGASADAIQLFRIMDLEGFQPTRVTIVSVLFAATAIQDPSLAHHILPDIRHSGLYREGAVGNSLVHLFGRSGRLDDAREIFQGMIDRSTVSWNIAITATAKAGHGRSALQLLESMALDGCAPDAITFSCVLFAWSHIGSLELAGECFRSMQQDFEVEALVEHFVAMIDLLARAGRADSAEELLHSMPYEPDDVALTTLAVARGSGGEVGGAASGAMAVMEMSPERPTAYVLLSSLSKQGGRERGIGFRV
ncbi:hypothetical protein SELMODRAFT_98963 [Selaginella moellendorffii]|uniref:Pentacotripeptide-repeat region of PRORP domain-containing protein n=1 Tax=Selaginella moellendorffii TaxID=88036 RepID=D8RQM7_SELML|nr:hypothetical protein SELMODRAFT_98963 [Selaginella moellendorffii]